MSNTSTASQPSIYVSVNGRRFRTKSIDRVARRLHGPNARVVIQERRNGLMHGFFVMPTRENPNIYVIRERFRQEDPDVARILRAHMRAAAMAEESDDTVEEETRAENEVTARRNQNRRVAHGG